MKIERRFPYARLIALICGALCILCWWRCCWRWWPCPVTTLLLIRHADPEDDGSTDPSLSTAGEARAQELIHVAGDAGISAIFVTEFQRTEETGQPLADHLGLTLTPYSAFDSPGLVNTIIANNAGDTVLAVGHSNTVPEIIELLGGGTQPVIASTEFDRLFVTTRNCRGHLRTVRLRYGT